MKWRRRRIAKRRRWLRDLPAPVTGSVIHPVRPLKWSLLIKGFEIWNEDGTTSYVPVTRS